MRRFGDADLAEESVQEAFGRAAAALAGRRRAGLAARLDRRHGGQRRDRPPAPRSAPCASELPALTPEPRRARGRPRGRCRARRPARADLHLLPSGSFGRGQRRADAAPGGRPADGRDRARLPRPRAGDGAAAGAREGQDPRGRHPFRRPPADLLAERLDHAAAVLYLVFNEGYSASTGDLLVRRDLCDEAIRLARLLVALMPAEPEAARPARADAAAPRPRRRPHAARSGGWCCSSTRTARAGIAAMIRAGQAELRREHGRWGRPGPTSCRRRSPRCMPRPPASRHRLAQVARLYAELAEMRPRRSST